MSTFTVAVEDPPWKGVWEADSSESPTAASSGLRHASAVDWLTQTSHGPLALDSSILDILDSNREPVLESIRIASGHGGGLRSQGSYISVGNASDANEDEEADTEVVKAPSEMTFDSVSPLTDREQLALRGLLHLVQREASRCSVQIIDLQLEKFYDPDDDVEELVISLRVPLPVREALHFWDWLGYATGEWVSSQPPHIQKVADERFTIDVEWDVV